MEGEKRAPRPPSTLHLRCNTVDEDCDGVLGYTYSLSANVQPIFNTYCVSCHSGSGASLGLHLDTGNSWNETVNIASTQLASRDRVEPGSAATSYLNLKVSNTHRAAGGSGSRMPPTGALSTANLGIIRTWIDEGAPNN